MATQLNIKSKEARDLADELARLTGQSITQSVVESLRDRLDRLRHASGTAEQRARARESGFYDLVAGSRDLWKRTALSLDHGDQLYDERGAPQ